MRNIRSSRQRGLTIVELILVMIISLALIVLSFIQFKVRDRDVMTQRLISDHFNLINSVHTIGAGRDNYFISGGWVAALKNANAIPPWMLTDTSANNLKHAMGGLITIEPNEFQGPLSGNTWPGIAIIRISYNNLERSACIRFVNAVAASSYDTHVNGTRVQLLNHPALNIVDITQLTTLCQNSNTNVVVVQQTQPIDIINYTIGSDINTPIQTTLYQKTQALRAQRASWH